MERAIQAAMFVDTVEVFGPGVFPASFQLFQRQFVRGIAIDLNGAKKNKYLIRTMKPRSFEQIYGPECIDFEIQDWDFTGLIVRRLRSTMNDQVELVFAKKLLERVSIADVQIDVREIPSNAAKALEIPCGVTGIAEENTAHVVIHADHLMSLTIEMLHSFRTDQPA